MNASPAGPDPAEPDPTAGSMPGPNPMPAPGLPPGPPVPPMPPVMPENLPPGAVAAGLAMKRRNPLAVWIGLPLITLGIYHLVWYYKIHREMAEFDRRRAVPIVGPMLVLLLLSWTVIAPFISYYNTGNRIRESQRSAGLVPTCSGLVGMLLMLVFGLGWLYYQIELNRVVDAYGVPEGTQIPLYV